MAVHSSYFLPVVDVPLQRLLEPAPAGRGYRKWVALLPVLVISAIVVALVLWGVFIAVEFGLSAAADTRANL